MYKKRYFFKVYVAVVIVLTAVKWVFGINIPATTAASPQPKEIPAHDVAPHTAGCLSSPAIPSHPHPVRGVHDYDECFPDSQEVQLRSAMRWGVKVLAPPEQKNDETDRLSYANQQDDNSCRTPNNQAQEAAEGELVYVGACPYYEVDKLWYSKPYLVPRAASLLHDIGRAYFDSLYVKGLPLQRILVTSVLRSQEDVLRLRRHNGNATQNSCHCYGTTFDISYNRFVVVQSPDGPQRREVRNDTLKYILSEVLRDKRQEGRCYIKYERKQGCFHITVR